MHRQYVVIVLIVLAAFFSGCVVIEDGEVGVSKSFGSISDEPVMQGIALQFPVVRTVTPWNIKLQEIKEAAQVPSSEGLIIGLDTSLLFKVIGEQAPAIRQNTPDLAQHGAQLFAAFQPMDHEHAVDRNIRQRNFCFIA